MSKEIAQGREEWESRVKAAENWSERAMTRLLLGVGEYIEREQFEREVEHCVPVQKLGFPARFIVMKKENAYRGKALQ